MKEAGRQNPQATDGNPFSPSIDGQAVMIGEDPLRLTVKSLGRVQADPYPYRGRYLWGSLVYRGFWYYGPYCFSPSSQCPREPHWV